ncbi:hypothetical protein ABHF33_15160 [Chitinibacter sp. FCG-7]|uniref:Uncharacterized protein n=1 Tax=Chitinibacter mangrovi TaxID=3153927 RepID=A0AAU7FA05_9NEIS
MTKPTPEPFLVDPLSDSAKSERKNLLISSFFGLVVALTGLVPTKISSLGIEFSLVDQANFLKIMAVLVAYFLIGFVVVATADAFILRKKYQDYLEHVQSYLDSWTEDDQVAHDNFYHSLPTISWFYQKSKWVLLARFVFDFILPIALGVTSCAYLLNKVA